MRPHKIPLRITLSVLLVAIFVLAHLERMPQSDVLAAANPQTARSTLRVGVWTLWHDRELLLKPASPDRKISLRTCEQCAALSLSQPVNIRAEGDAVTLTGSGKRGNTTRLWLAGPVTLAAHGETVTLHNPVTITARSGVLVIAVTLPIESYVESVVASESGPDDSQQSLQALAIVVRTFALHEAHGHADFDLCDSTHCQLLHWGGNPGRQHEAHAATLATASETLRFHGAPALAYFNKDCGGRTALPAEIWPRARAVPYLPSQPDRYCTAGGGKEWASELTRAELSAALAAAGVAAPGWRLCPSIAEVSQGARSRSTLTQRQSPPRLLSQLAVGQALGWNRIPGTWFEVSQQGDRFFFHGRGWGHGVGLCQKGAAAMAEQGRSAQQILQQYFPGAQAADEATGKAWQLSQALASCSNLSMLPMPLTYRSWFAHVPKHRSVPA